MHYVAIAAANVAGEFIIFAGEQDTGLRFLADTSLIIKKSPQAIKKGKNYYQDYDKKLET